MKLLCLADVHLGRAPARLHPDLSPLAASLGPSAAWRRAVELALAERVDAVLLAGDLVDGGNDFFEAFSDLRWGARRLAEAGVEVVAVAGNHDVEVLPRLVEAVPEVRQLGAGGRWQAHDIGAAGGTGAVRVVGWSFPARWVDDSPLAGGGLERALQAPAGAGAPAPRAVIGLLHADRDQGLSRYAPVTSAELSAAPVDAWLLGHVHRPGPPPLPGAGAWEGGYLGSLTANDPGEAGARGAWLVEVGGEGAGALTARHVPLAPLRWERLEVDVGALQHAEEVPGLVAASLERLDRRLREGGASPVAVGCRLVLTGRTRLRPEIARQLETASPSRQPLQLGDVHYFIDEVRLEALPALDLRELARASDPVGLLAARIVALGEPGSPLRERLVARARPRLEELHRQRVFVGAAAPALHEGEIAELLEEAALRALDSLLAQTAGNAGPERAS